MATTLAASNGKKETATAKPTAETLPTIPPAKRADGSEQKPLEDRIYRVQQLSDLIAKREKLQESLKKLKAFKLSTDSRLDSLTIEDGEGNEFVTSNTAAITDVIECLKATLQKKLHEVEAQIVF
jgi:hypothetical protein